MIRPTAVLAAAASLALLTAGPVRSAPLDFGLGQNAESQACRAQARFGREEARQVDIFCGEWDRPSGWAAVLPSARRAEAEALLAAECKGEVRILQSPSFADLRQVACAPAATGGLRRFGFIAARGDAVVVGSAYPADWSPLVRAGEVLSGAATATAAATAADSPGMREIQAVFPEGPPGQSAAFNYELLRRRAYEKNAVWNFGGSQRDFTELLAAHRALAPEDILGEAEIMAEVGLNLSGEQRFDEAGATLSRAEAKAREGGDGLLASKIVNYRAIDLMNRRRYAEAYDLAQSANAQRAARLSGDGRTGPLAISASDAAAMERARLRRSLLVQMGQPSEAERAAVLSAQADYISAAALSALRRPGADALLDRAEARLAAAASPAPWLKAMIAEERAKVRLARGDSAGAAAAASEGLRAIRASAPNTRTEAHLLLALAAAQRQGGNEAAGLESGRQAVAIFAAQKESPGMPSDLAAGRLDALLAAWRRTGDPALAAEFFATSSLTWDGAAARSALQLAARLAANEATGEARTYQDAERSYRAALARRERLAEQPDAKPERMAEAEAAVQAAAGRLNAAEATLRASSPRFIELLSPRVDAADMMSVLAPDEAYIRLVLTASGGYGVAVTRNGVAPYAVALTEGEAEALVRRLRDSSRLHGRRLPDFDLAAASELYERLLGPARTSLEGVRRLQIDGAGVLAAAPFAALLTSPPTEAQLEAVRTSQVYAGLPWLARTYALAQSVGPAPFVRMRRAAAATATAAPRAAVFGDFRPDPLRVAARIAAERGLSPQCEAEVRAALQRLDALPETAGEAEQTAALFGAAARVRLGADFTDSGFMKAEDVGQASVIVLATHGVLGLSACFAEPALLASIDADGDGLIEASELLDRRLSARLVVLSACDTAGGGRADVAATGLSDGGEALSGLARGFLYAGASSVMATQWKVDAAASASEVRRFFEAAIRDGDGMAAALNQAQAALFDDPETGHPFYWAAFTLIGDGGATLAAGNRSVAAR